MRRDKCIWVSWMRLKDQVLRDSSRLETSTSPGMIIIIQPSKTSFWIISTCIVKYAPSFLLCLTRSLCRCSIRKRKLFWLISWLNRYWRFIRLWICYFNQPTLRFTYICRARLAMATSTSTCFTWSWGKSHMAFPKSSTRKSFKTQLDSPSKLPF